ncbi:transglycosylase domain-containing protein [Fictibacillus barbaricus]|uniref:PBP1A family penicillin-binding protein n=1 Tax=Fictibacillus barbaricus TaxID=182136 RepID=A0ABS2Z8U0_9BACL|nr:PBP1A family penicillin-binding protein [Fictibacillus barbaricus]MBN3543972.1 PBP1A family penicillin-binding protein [Fictibacillus barbaricus]
MAKRTELRQRKKRSRWIRRTAIITLIFFLSSVTFGGAMIYAYVNGTPKLTDADLQDPQSSMIFDMNDEFVTYVTGSERREYTNIEDIPKLVQQAFISTEDVRFKDHRGVDVKRILGAAVANIQDGFGAEGASTITQQVVKNSVLSSDKTIERKVQEAYLAIQLEQKYSKDEILEMYLNKIYFGGGAYGVATASKTYFNKPLKDLTPAEAALLAGLPQRPSSYDPFLHPKAAEERRNTVLQLMYKNGAITKKQKDEAVRTSVTDSLVKEKSKRLKFDSFVQRVIEELKEKGISERAIYEGGLKIYTTLDPKAQAHTEKVLSTEEYVKYPNDKFKAGVALLDTKTGVVRALGGNRTSGEQDIEKGFNYATDITRQPGSTIKPILDYGPAIEKLKWSTYKQIKDEELEIDGWEAGNWDDEFHGDVSMREALVMSYNIPAIKTFMEVGSEDAVNFAKQLGIPIETAHPAYAIGGFKHGPSPLELAGAYTAFGNQGIYHKPTTLRKVTFPDGYETKYESKPVAAMHDYTAYMITDMLKDVVKRGTGTLAAIPGLEVAGKTGTTNLPEGINIEKGSSDSWFAGFTTNYTAAVWTGYDKTTAETYLTPEDQKIAKYIFKSIVGEVSKDKQTAAFKKPESVEEIYINKDTGYITKNKTGPNIAKELIVKGTSLKDLTAPVKVKTAPKKTEPKNQEKKLNDKDKKAEENEKEIEKEEEKETQKEDEQNTEPPPAKPKDDDEGDPPPPQDDNPDDPGTDPEPEEPPTEPEEPEEPEPEPDTPPTEPPPEEEDTTGTGTGAGTAGTSTSTQTTD